MKKQTKTITRKVKTTARKTKKESKTRKKKFKKIHDINVEDELILKKSFCICPNCNDKVPSVSTCKCEEINCPNCGSSMISCKKRKND